MLLKNKTIVVTGAGGALGQEVVATANEAGAKVAEFDMNFDNAGSLPTTDKRWLVDLTDTAAASSAIAEVGAEMGDIDAVFNIAGGFSMGPAVHETSTEDWDHLFRMNVVTLQNTLSAAIPVMLANGHGSIVNVGALSAREGQGQMGAYCAAKSVVMRLTESMSKELRHQGINVNAVLPSIIDTPTNRNDMPDADFSKWVKPRELANVICFLGSDAASAVHGALIPVQGLA